MPASVIGGIIGFILMNIPGFTEITNVDAGMCNTIVGFFFTLSFISIGLTATPKEDGKSSGDTAKQMVKGSLGMGLLWGALYCFTPIVGFLCISLLGKPFNMPAEYGALIQFAFCQGPGQSAAFGAQIEAAGAMPGAGQVAITYSVIGFLFAFLVGVPMAKIGLKKGLASHPEKLSTSVLKGIYPPEQQTETCGKITTYNGNIDVLAFHMALVGLTFIITLYVQKLILMIPVSVVQTMGSMTFFVGLFVAYVVKWALGQLNLKQYHDDILQARITGCTTDFLIVGAFMAVQMAVIGKWLVPIILMCVVVGIFTLAVALFFGPRLGGTCDFERTLGLWGCLTGTCPSGVALIRIVDPNLRTTASTEMGAMNAAMIPGTLIIPFIIEALIGHMQFLPTVALMCLGLGIINIILMKVVGTINKPTYSFRTSVVCPDVSDDCERFEVSGTHSPF
jgi:ESS family glutamate:Na+ symporter